MGNLCKVNRKDVISYNSVPEFNNNVLTIGRSVSTSICDSIIYEANSICGHGYSFPSEIAVQCMKYLRFVMNSKILNDSEKCEFHQLLMDHHLDKNIISPLLDTKYITYFDILYRKSSNASHSNYQMLSFCVGKPNLIMIFQTNYNHIFSIYLRNPLEWIGNTWLHSKPNDEKSALFLLRSQHIYGNKQCPRKINIGPGNSKWVSFRSAIYGKNAMCIAFMGISISEESDNKNYVSVGWRLDTLGNEICGGESFDDTKSTESRTHGGIPKEYPFGLTDIEIYQIL